MEKTILYSKKSSIAQSLKQYECCEHEHCKQLLLHVKFLSKTLTQKLLKDHLDHNPTLKSKENLIDKPDKTPNKTIEEQIELIRKNYLKLKKQLQHIETQNDQLFEENLQLKQKVKKLEESLTNFQLNKSNFDISVIRSHEPSPIETKNSFYQQQASTRCSQLTTKENISPIGDQFPHHIDLTLNNILKGCPKDSDCNVYLTERTEIFDKYEKLLGEYRNTEEELLMNEEKLRDFEKTNKKLQYENYQLKKIIKLRNEIQSSRHEAISGLRNVIDEIMS